MNRKNFIVLPVLLLAISLLNAGVPETCLLFSITSKNIARLGIVNISDKNLSLNIQNTAGKIFFSEIIKKGNNYFKFLDLSALPDGSYTVELSGDKEDFVKGFSKTGDYTSATELIKEKAPDFQRVDNKTFGFVYSNVRNSVISVEMEHDEEIVFEENNLTGAVIVKKYSLEKLPKGTYTFKIHAADKVYSYKLTVK